MDALSGMSYASDKVTAGGEALGGLIALLAYLKSNDMPRIPRPSPAIHAFASAPERCALSLTFDFRRDCAADHLVHVLEGWTPLLVPVRLYYSCSRTLSAALKALMGRRVKLVNEAGSATASIT